MPYKLKEEVKVSILIMLITIVIGLAIIVTIKALGSPVEKSKTTQNCQNLECAHRGDLLIHKFTGDTLMYLKYNRSRNMHIARTKSLTQETFREDELILTQKSIDL
jgi:hypothetical protein